MSTLEINTAIEHTSRKRLIDYPEGDGKPMAETDVHVLEMMNCLAVLMEFFTRDDDVYVASNNFVYWKEGSLTNRLSPDVYVVHGAKKKTRRSYKSWQEGGKLPDVIFEFTSKSTKKEDIGRKFSTYEQVWQTSEYFLFDPTGDYLSPRLQGYRLLEGRYAPLEMVDGRLFSERLGLELFVDGGYLRFYSPQTETVLNRIDELSEFGESQRRQKEEALMIANREKRRADVQTQLADEERAIAQTEKQRADEARDIAQAEKQRADDNQAIIRKLMAQLEERDRKDNTDER